MEALFSSDEAREELIMQVQQHPCLYDAAQESYIKLARDNAWTKVAEACGCPGNESTCKLVWKRLKEKYKREKEKFSNTKSGSAATKSKVWSLYKTIQFIDDFMQTRPTTSNLPDLGVTSLKSSSMNRIVDDSLISCNECDIINLSSSAHETCFQQRTKLSQFARGSFVLEGDSQNVTRAVKTAYDEERKSDPNVSRRVGRVTPGDSFASDETSVSKYGFDTNASNSSLDVDDDSVNLNCDDPFAKVVKCVKVCEDSSGRAAGLHISSSDSSLAAPPGTGSSKANTFRAKVSAQPRKRANNSKEWQIDPTAEAIITAIEKEGRRESEDSIDQFYSSMAKEAWKLCNKKRLKLQKNILELTMNAFEDEEPDTRT